jgi:hypothetical protein
MHMAQSSPGAGLSEAAARYRDRILGYLPFRFFTWWKLPLAAFAGLRVHALERRACEVSVPFGWRTQNPFGSTYFAAHAMAAEMSTGALVLLHVEDLARASGRSVSTLITAMHATYGKAAKAETRYRCEQGEEIGAAVRRALETGEPVTVEVVTRGTMGGEPASEFRFTWSMKRREKP